MQSAAIGAIPTLTLCCFVTLSIYAGNVDEFSASFVELLRVYLPFMVLLISAFGLLGAVMTRTGLSRFLALISALAVLLWLQGNILVWDYGVLDGREIEWLSGSWRGVLDLTIWTSVLLLAWNGHKRFGNTLVYTAIATLAFQSIGTVATLSSDASQIFTRSSNASSRAGFDAMTRFSRNKNVVHIVMDGFQSDIFAEIVEGSARIRQDLQGFTVFQNNLGAYPYTQLSLPALVSGKLYRNHIPVDAFISETLQGHTILSAVYDAGFEVDIAAPVGLKNIYSQAQHTHAYGITDSDHVTRLDYIKNDSAKLMDLALFRVVPHFAKALVYRDELWVFQAKVRAEAYLQMQYFSDLAFLGQLAERMSVDRDAPVYKMIHVMLSHRPTVGNERCEYDGKRAANRETVTTQARCGLLQVLKVLQRMRELGIYDDSLIVLMADHGAWVPVEQLHESGREASGSEPGVASMTVAMAIPVLAIKPPGSTDDYNVSDAPTSIIDVPATIADILDIDVQFDGMSVFSIDPSAPRQRRHFPMQEFVVDGSPFDARNWHRGERYLPQGADRRE